MEIGAAPTPGPTSQDQQNSTPTAMEEATIVRTAGAIPSEGTRRLSRHQGEFDGYLVPNHLDLITAQFDSPGASSFTGTVPSLFQDSAIVNARHQRPMDATPLGTYFGYNGHSDAKITTSRAEPAASTRLSNASIHPKTKVLRCSQTQSQDTTSIQIVMGELFGIDASPGSG
jgi:hypothetical protein